MVEMKQGNKNCLCVYTRETCVDSYPDGLARSIHLAYSKDGIHYNALNCNYGILFAEAEITEKNTISPRGVRNPWIFKAEKEKYGILAVRTLEDRGEENEKKANILIWLTDDFIRFEKIICIGLEVTATVKRVECRYDLKKAKYELYWEDVQGKSYCLWLDHLEQIGAVKARCSVEKRRHEILLQGPEGAITGNAVSVDQTMCDRIVQHWTPLYHTKTIVPKSVFARTESDVQNIQATAMYSDGSTAQKRVEWNCQGINFRQEGIYQVEGSLKNEFYHFPLAVGYGDPVIFPWEGSWYFIATNDNKNDIALYVRKADCVSALFEKGREEHIILDVDESKGFMQTFWAPEFHVIGGELYLLFAVSGKIWGPQCHMMKLKKGGDIIDPEAWETPIRIQKKDGSYLSEDGITLDMTYLQAGNASYVVWSYRNKIGTSEDTGSMLYIAQVDEETPWRLKSEPVLLSRPLFGWENVNGTINNEGPHAFVKEGRVYLTYSGGAANSYTYAVGLLTADVECDLLNPANWKKTCTPLLSYYSVEGEYGPGHNSFYVDKDGELYIAYHAEDMLESTTRCDGIRRVHFDLYGNPHFNISDEDDLQETHRKVYMQVIVKENEE